MTCGLRVTAVYSSALRRGFEPGTLDARLAPSANFAPPFPQTKLDAAFTDLDKITLDRPPACSEYRREAIKEPEAKVETCKWCSESLWNTRSFTFLRQLNYCEDVASLW